MTITESFIFWDWNGTLLDDAETCLTTMNNMLKKRNMPGISIDFYRNAFGFPVKDYYRKVGFDFVQENFEALSVEFMDGYHSSLVQTPLVKGAEEVLQYFLNAGKNNIIISAMQQDMLIKSVEITGLTAYFSDILGIDNIYAASKSKMASRFVTEKDVSPETILFIGDTVHDFEVAQEIGCRCILIADGHQAEDRLKNTGAEVFGSILDLLTARF
jgi:phosphoglycolate phosphatase